MRSLVICAITDKCEAWHLPSACTTQRGARDGSRQSVALSDRRPQFSNGGRSPIRPRSPASRPFAFAHDSHCSRPEERWGGVGACGAMPLVANRRGQRSLGQCLRTPKRRSSIEALALGAEYSDFGAQLRSSHSLKMHGSRSVYVRITGKHISRCIGKGPEPRHLHTYERKHWPTTTCRVHPMGSALPVQATVGMEVSTLIRIAPPRSSASVQRIASKVEESMRQPLSLRHINRGRSATRQALDADRDERTKHVHLALRPMAVPTNGHAPAHHTLISLRPAEAVADPAFCPFPKQRAVFVAASGRRRPLEEGGSGKKYSGARAGRGSARCGTIATEDQGVHGAFLSDVRKYPTDAASLLFEFGGALKPRGRVAADPSDSSSRLERIRNTTAVSTPVMRAHGLPSRYPAGGHSDEGLPGS